MKENILKTSNIGGGWNKKRKKLEDDDLRKMGLEANVVGLTYGYYRQLVDSGEEAMKAKLAKCGIDNSGQTIEELRAAVFNEWKRQFVEKKLPEVLRDMEC